MDDQELIYSSPARVQQTMRQIASLGIDRIKVSLVWNLIAPDPNSTQRPDFDATDPSAYPTGAWSRYDLIVKLAQQLGIKVYFQIDGGAPTWAVPASELRESEQLGRAPDLTDFERFVEAAGRRYSGSFVPPSNAPGSPGLLPIAIPGLSPPPPQPAAPLPRVSFWSVWNEPNVPAWLNPWYRPIGHRQQELLEPSLYRGLVNAAWEGVRQSGHTTGTDTVLIGETANSGVGTVSQFVRGLYCVAPSMRQLRRNAATRVGCPTSGSRTSFVEANPGLFYSTGFAHHPYSFNQPPNVPYPLADWITLYNLGSFERMLNRIFASYGARRRGGVPLYLTEFGYESNPPNPFVKNSTAQQAAWLNDAEYMAFKDPYVRDLTQFELVDSLPNTAEKKGSYAYWTTSFQTGLEFAGGQPKPAFSSFRIPIWLPVARHGRAVKIWGQLRPANHAGPQSAMIEFERRGATSFRQLREIGTTNSEGFLLARLAIPAAGLVRIAWVDPASGAVDYSRTVRVS